MTALTYTDAVGAVKAWINGNAALSGLGNPLQKGATTKHLIGAASACYAYLEETTTTQGGGAENPDMFASIGAQVYGGTREAATLAAVALAEELTQLALSGRPASVTGATILVADNITGPSWAPDETDTPRLLLQFDVQVRPA